MIAKLTISYRGTAYAGWQRQTNALAVQQIVEEALGALLGPTHGAPRITGAGRTDAGVHARGQVAHLELAQSFPLKGLVHGTNHHLDRRGATDIRVLAAEEAPADFHARFSALAKVYSYRLVRTDVLSPLDALFAIRVEPRIDSALLQQAADLLVGHHNFSAFALSGGAAGDPHRTVFAARWNEKDDHCCFSIVGDGFLRGMVRSIVGTLIEVGLRERSIESFKELVLGAPRCAAGPTAPPQGLTLEEVFYSHDGLAKCLEALC